MDGVGGGRRRGRTVRQTNLRSDGRKNDRTTIFLAEWERSQAQAESERRRREAVREGRRARIESVTRTRSRRGGAGVSNTQLSAHAAEKNPVDWPNRIHPAVLDPQSPHTPPCTPANPRLSPRLRTVRGLTLWNHNPPPPSFSLQTEERTLQTAMKNLRIDCSNQDLGRGGGSIWKTVENSP